MLDVCTLTGHALLPLCRENIQFREAFAVHHRLSFVPPKSAVMFDGTGLMETRCGLNNEGVRDLFVLFGEIPRDDQVAREKLRVKLEQGPHQQYDGKLPEEVLRFYSGMYHEFQELFAEFRGTNRLFTMPLSEFITLLRFPVEHAEELAFHARDLGRDLWVTIFDTSVGYFYRPDGFRGIEMTVEDQPLFIFPNSDQISRIVGSLTANGGPSTLVLNADDGSFAQVAGGDGKFTCECREISSNSFQHWVAGRKTKVSGKIRIPTNGYQVTVNSNECLSVTDVTLILNDFARGKPRSQKWTWREITDEFR